MSGFPLAPPPGASPRASRQERAAAKGRAPMSPQLHTASPLSPTAPQPLTSPQRSGVPSQWPSTSPSPPAASPSTPFDFDDFFDPFAPVPTAAKSPSAATAATLKPVTSPPSAAQSARSAPAWDDFDPFGAPSTVSAAAAASVVTSPSSAAAAATSPTSGKAKKSKKQPIVESSSSSSSSSSDSSSSDSDEDDDAKAKKAKAKRKAARKKAAAAAAAGALSPKSAATITDATTIFINVLPFLRTGTTFLKFSKHAAPHAREFHLSDDHTTLEWTSPAKRKSETRVELAWVTEVRLGQRTPIFRNHIGDELTPRLADRSFSLVYGHGGDQTLDLVAADAHDYMVWTRALIELVNLARTNLTNEHATPLDQLPELKIEFQRAPLEEGGAPFEGLDLERLKRVASTGGVDQSNLSLTDAYWLSAGGTRTSYHNTTSRQYNFGIGDSVTRAATARERRHMDDNHRRAKHRSGAGGLDMNTVWRSASTTGSVAEVAFTAHRVHSGQESLAGAFIGGLVGGLVSWALK